MQSSKNSLNYFSLKDGDEVKLATTHFNLNNYCKYSKALPRIHKIRDLINIVNAYRSSLRRTCFFFLLNNTGSKLLN